MAEKQELEKAFEQYAERMNQVSELSKPSLETVDKADDYSKLLIYNFKKIGELAGANRGMIEQVLMPLIDKEEPLSEDEIEALEGLNNLLINMTDVNQEEIDCHLAELTNERIEKERDKDDTELNGDSTSVDARIRILDKNMDIYVNKMLDSLRSHNYEEAKRVQTRGVECYEEILSYLEKDRYEALSEISKYMILSNTYYGANLYDYFDEEKMISQLACSRSILQDPFYLKELPDFDTRCHIFHTYEYVAMMVFFAEYKHQETYQAAFENACEVERIWNSDPEYYGKYMRKEVVATLCLYGAARIQDPSMEKRLIDVIGLYDQRDVTDYSFQGINLNLDSIAMLFDVLEIARKNKRIGLSERFLRLQRQIPYDFLDYLYHIDNIKLSTRFMACVANLLEGFEEVPGGMTGGELFQKVIVAVHPPTYVHSHMVAQFALCLTRHVLERKPELFVKYPGCGSVAAVFEKKDEILQYTYHAALYHDIGKLMILDTIAMYGRKLLDTEFLQLKVHPDNGAGIARRMPSLKAYEDVIRGHHIWYDGSRGYPLEFNTAESPYKTIIDIVMAVDCLDAATDRVGRSYSKGKTLDEYKAEVQEGAGTRYAPWLPEILEDPVVDADLHLLLEEGRKRIYRETFMSLKEIAQLRG